MRSPKQTWRQRSWRWTKTDTGVVVVVLGFWLASGLSRDIWGRWHYHLDFTVPLGIAGGAALIWLFGAWCARGDRKQGVDRGKPPSFSGEDSWGPG